MAQLDVTITKGRTADIVEARLPAGAPVSFTFPKKGPIPHDYVHLIVEEGLGFGQGFWGMVAGGVAPAAIQEIAKAGGHASAKRAQTPDPSIVELIQAERLVECFEADLWGEPTDFDTFRSVADAACAASLVPAVVVGDDDIAAIRARIATFAQEWIAAPIGAQFRFSYGPAD